MVQIAATPIKPTLIRFGAEVEAILKRRPQTGALFEYLRTVRPGDRATELKQRCDGLEIKGVSLHSYRYAWTERALSRFAIIVLQFGSPVRSLGVDFPGVLRVEFFNSFRQVASVLWIF